MKQHEAQCLICHRNRVEKWVCGAKVDDAITTNKYSDWVDTFTQTDHKHVWIGHTRYNRSHWFGKTSIACGGMPTIPRVFEQRVRLGDIKSQRLATSFHKLVEAQKSTITLSAMFRELETFTKAVVENPESLLSD